MPGIDCGLALAAIYLEWLADDPTFSLQFSLRERDDGVPVMHFGDGEHFAIGQWTGLPVPEVMDRCNAWIADQVARLGIHGTPLQLHR